MKTLTEHAAQQFIRNLTTALATIRLYDTHHPQVLNLCRQALEQLHLHSTDTGDVTLKLINNRLVFQDVRLTENLSVESLIRAMQNHDLSFIKFDVTISLEDLLQLAEKLSRHPLHTEAKPFPASDTIIYGKVSVRPQTPETTSDAASCFQDVVDENLDKFMDIYRNIGHGKTIHASGLEEIVRQFISVFHDQQDAMLALAPIRSMDEYLYTHSTNICLLNLAQARLLGIDGQMLNDIGIAAMLHDAGKMFIPSEVLHKPGKLDDREWELMRDHPRLGAQYLLNCPGIPRLAVVTAYEHHIGYDGSGYPVSFRKLNPCSYMTSISDIYDALRTRRTYKEPLSFDQIKTIMSGSAGKALHPQLTDSFLTALSQLEQQQPDA
ncbi:MAG TPA: HD domain-containing phosphohydrolase [Pelovirga sp.]|nr:HD domain-containing phosphohydrolase [Pelovirga sp.]